MIRQFLQVTIWFVLLSALVAVASAADCPSGQCPRPAVRVRVVTPAVRVDVRARPVDVRVRFQRVPIRAWFGLFPRME
jgi:hypothetical protein